MNVKINVNSLNEELKEGLLLLKEELAFEMAEDGLKIKAQKRNQPGYEKNKDEENIVEVIAFDFLKTNVLIGNIQKDKEYGLKGYLVYDVGLGELVTEEFFDTSFIINMDEYLIMEIGQIDDFTEIGVEFNTNNPALNIIKLKVGNTDLKDKYQVINNYTPIYISVGLSLIVLGIGVGYYFYRKRKNSR